MCVYIVPIVPKEGEERRSGRSHFFGQILIGLLLTERWWSVQLMMGPASLFAPSVDLHDVLRG